MEIGDTAIYPILQYMCILFVHCWGEKSCSNTAKSEHMGEDTLFNDCSRYAQ